ncbi:MAG: hypothetical protein ACP5H2_07680 [Solirubrobacteraceae bacterium]
MLSGDQPTTPIEQGDFYESDHSAAVRWSATFLDPALDLRAA